MTKINATVVADSKNLQGDRLTTMMITFPRFILAELNTHRMLSKNSASSRAIPFNKMVEAVQNNPFIPIAWQKEHKGMQGSEYKEGSSEIQLCINKWLEARDNAIQSATLLNKNEIVTKQLCNRLLEPFMWHTVIVTATEWENFFALRCPQYSLFHENMPMSFRSKKDFLAHVHKVEAPEFKNQYDNLTELDWLQINKGQAEIHMMALAEAMWDAMNESTPKELKAGEWHIPFEDKISSDVTFWSNDIKVQAELWGKDLSLLKVKVSTAMAAHTSYTTVGNEPVKSYEKWIELHDRLISYDPPHSSPMEHCARAMSKEEYKDYVKGKFEVTHSEPNYEDLGEFPESAKGWCRNFKGFIQYRELLENKKV